MAKNGLHLLKPTTVDKTGGSSTATINANGSVTFSSCATLSLNGVFSADYDNYIVVMRSSASNNANLTMRLRAAGTDNSTASSYVRQYIEATGATIASGRATANASVVAGLYPAQRDGVMVSIYGPYLSQPTAYRSITALGYLNAYLNDFAVTHNQSTSYDGFSFIMDSGITFTGLVAVYGMRK